MIQNGITESTRKVCTICLTFHVFTINRLLHAHRLKEILHELYLNFCFNLSALFENDVLYFTFQFCLK